MAVIKYEVLIYVPDPRERAVCLIVPAQFEEVLFYQLYSTGKKLLLLSLYSGIISGGAEYMQLSLNIFIFTHVTQTYFASVLFLIIFI